MNLVTISYFPDYDFDDDDFDDGETVASFTVDRTVIELRERNGLYAVFTNDAPMTDWLVHRDIAETVMDQELAAAAFLHKPGTPEEVQAWIADNFGEYHLETSFILAAVHNVLGSMFGTVEG